MTKIAPSILSADFARLGAEVSDVKAAGADYLHFDVMDGIFVPNISAGIPILSSLRKSTDLFLDVHLMIKTPLHLTGKFCEAGADLVNFHVEADTRENILRAISLAKEYGKKAGITLKPATEAEEVFPFLDLVDLVLVMTVEPGFGGQKFMLDQLPKIKQVRKMIDATNPACELEVDGGINISTAKLAAEAGANVLVAGSSVFGASDRAKAIRAIRV